MTLVGLIVLTIGVTAAIRAKLIPERMKIKGWMAFALSVLVSAGVVAFSFFYMEIPFVFSKFIVLVPQVVAGSFFGFQGLKIPARTNKEPYNRPGPFKPPYL